MSLPFQFVIIRRFHHTPTPPHCVGIKTADSLPSLQTGLRLKQTPGNCSPFLKQLSLLSNEPLQEDELSLQLKIGIFAIKAT